jgi:heme exporter protein A
VQAIALVRSFGGRQAVSGVSFSLHAGECLAVFGPNGAGKSTLLRVLAGILKPTSGSALVCGEAHPANSEARARVGYVAHGSMLYAALTALENVTFTARMFGLPNPVRAAADALERIGASRFSAAPVRTLSRGQQQRVAIARALVHAPSVLLLDEPYSGLDEPGSRRLSALLSQFRLAGAALVVVTHNMPEGLSLASHAAIMLDGAFVHFTPALEMDRVAYSGRYHELVAHGE